MSALIHETVRDWQAGLRAAFSGVRYPGDDKLVTASKDLQIDMASAFLDGLSPEEFTTDDVWQDVFTAYCFGRSLKSAFDFAKPLHESLWLPAFQPLGFKYVAPVLMGSLGQAYGRTSSCRQIVSVISGQHSDRGLAEAWLAAMSPSQRKLVHRFVAHHAELAQSPNAPPPRERKGRPQR